MLDKLLNQIQTLERGLDAVSMNGEAIAGNIANADTVGYQAKSVDFAEVFQNAIHPSDLSTSDSKSGQVYKAWLDQSDADFGVSRSNQRDTNISSLDFSTQNSSSSVRIDGNNVDIDQQMTELAKNQVTYEALTYAVSKELGRIGQVLRDDR